MIQVYFSDFFGVNREALEAYGAFNVSLVNDLPLFIDPFLLFNGNKPEYQRLHEEIIRYLRFLRDKSGIVGDDDGVLRSWYVFSEVRQNWLGFSRFGNRGSGLGMTFARALKRNLGSVFQSFGGATIAKSNHLEKLCLIEDGVGRDNISDFTTNLIKEFLVGYTARFASEHVEAALKRTFSVPRVRFNYATETWESDHYELPCYGGDYVLLTPKDILTKDDIWISRTDFMRDYEEIAESIPDEQLRFQVNNYFRQQLSKKPDQKEIRRAIEAVVRRYPKVLEYYVARKEVAGDEATAISRARVRQTEDVFIRRLSEFIASSLAQTGFYSIPGNTLEEARARVMFLKDVIENKGGHRVFYHDGKPLTSERDVQVLFRLTWYGTECDVNREVNNGRGPVDFAISRGRRDKSLVEFKLASNTHLKRNLQRQVPIYEKASNARDSLKVILYFSEAELLKVMGMLHELRLESDSNIILIDARRDNKPSGSVA